MGSVTNWIDALGRRDEVAAEKLWARYHSRLVGIAKHKLRGSPRREVDEEDIALAAFTSLCLGAADGRFPRLRDRSSLWPLLVVLTAHKATDQLRHERAAKRDVRCEASTNPVEEIIAKEPTPAMAALLAEEYRLQLERLGDPGLREIAVSRLDGFTNEEIAARLGISSRTVARKLVLIRRKMEEGQPL